MDISYKAIGINTDGLIILSVIGDTSETEKED